MNLHTSSKPQHSWGCELWQEYLEAAWVYCSTLVQDPGVVGGSIAQVEELLVEELEDRMQAQG
jgi:hypothetical protein